MTAPGLPPLADVSALATWTDRPADDPALARAVASASARFRGAVRHPVTRVDNEETWLDGNGTTVLLLPAVPVVTVSEVAVSGLLVSDYRWSRNGMLERASGWPSTLNAVRVVYSHGYDTVPDEVADAVLHHARYLLALEPGVAAMSVGGESVTYADTMGAALPDAWNRAVSAHAINQGDQA